MVGHGIRAGGRKRLACRGGRVAAPGACLGLGTILAAFLFSPMAIILSGATMRGEPDVRGLAWLALLVNAAAIGLAILALV